jgi:hypothetical protein
MLARGFEPPRSKVRRATLFRVLAALALAIPLLARPAFGAGANVTSATAVQKEEAGKSFQRGAQALSAGKLDDAVAEFERSLGAVDSPNTRLMLARALVKLGRPVQAFREFERTMASAEQAAQVDKKYASAGEAARADVADVRSQVGLVTVRVSGAADSLSVAGESVAREAWERPIAVAPGKVRVVLTSAQGEAVREIEVAAGGSAEVEIAPPAAAAPAPAVESPVEAQVSTGSSSKRTIAYVAGGVGIAGIVSFAVFGAMNDSKYRKLQDSCISNVCDPDLRGERDTGQTYQTVANVSLVVGAIGLGTSAALLLLSGGDSEPEKTGRVRRGNGMSARLGVGPGYVDVSGSF